MCEILSSVEREREEIPNSTINREDPFPVPLHHRRPPQPTSLHHRRPPQPNPSAPPPLLTAITTGLLGTSTTTKIIGHVGTRTQPARYVTQHRSILARPTYMQPNSQNVMVGRLGGQLDYMHPIHVRYGHCVKLKR
ncbi:uncharacterized protein LOC131306898 [Rhododendron vialii]|uniref:uncharacterized protein LOC131306898 n=1 Tax=Rhododendron vialii TaxID=182163 RepID=UPI00265E3786|nr:uncharacterized protein LOC131306898 [Rhododendron vialii]